MDDALYEFHRVHPGATTRALARGTTGDGRSSYDRLAEFATQRSGRQIVDLGCGDGYLLERLIAQGVAPERLIGVDLSPHELALARARPALAGVTLRCESAQDLSLATGSASVVLSHLGFTVMSDIEQVVASVARMLMPGGVFATMVGGGPRLTDNAFAVFVDLLDDIARDHAASMPALGNRRARTDAGLAELFSADTGFTAPQISDLDLALDGSGDQVWASLVMSYEVHALPVAARQALQRRFFAKIDERWSPGQKIPCTMYLRLVACRRL